MVTRAEVTREIERSPSGPKIAAFFDVDRTLVAGFSATAFVRDKLSSGDLSLADVLGSARAAARFGFNQTSFPTLIEESSSDLVGMTEEELAEVGERVFVQRLATEIYPESRALVKAHQRRGHTVAIVSSATRFQIEALARDLSIEHVLCTELELRGGRFTGKVVRPACYLEGKADAASALADSLGIDLAQSYFYTDSHDDISLLEIVGNPRLINPDRALSEIAIRRGWPIRRFTSRGRPGARELLGLSLSLGATLPSALVGLPLGLAKRSVRQGLDVAMSTYSDLSLALTGVDLQVKGEEHLWSHRPAVFIFNHQSGLDALLIPKLLRRDAVGVGKKEIRDTPIVGRLGALAGTVYVDRANTARAIEQMKPAVEALRRGLSIYIAPEGTRSPTPRLGRFKKGAFHMALAARVPIVPIVFKNALDALPKHGLVIRPATIEAVVHPPIPTEDWTREELDERIAEIHQLYERTLAA